MNKKEKRWVVPLLWIMFLTVVTGIAIVSIQNGEETKHIGEVWIYRLAQKLDPEDRVTQEGLSQVTYIVRQLIREIAFFVIGILGTITIHATCKKKSWFIKTEISAVILALIAYFTEAVKQFIPGRHYSEDEMMLSMGAAAAGFLLVSLFSLLRMGFGYLINRKRKKRQLHER